MMLPVGRGPPMCWHVHAPWGESLIAESDVMDSNHVNATNSPSLLSGEALGWEETTSQPISPQNYRQFWIRGNKHDVN